MRFNIRGKLPPDILFNNILSRLPTSGEKVLLGPSIGEDAAILDVNNDLLAIHSDPVTGGGNFAGLLSVYVASNDIATRGLRPKWLLTVILFREGVKDEEIRAFVDQVGTAAREIGASIIGGHTEITPNLPFNIVVTTALSTGKKVAYTRDAKVGDLLVVTKDIALEGTAILSSELSEELVHKGVKASTLKRAEGFVREISIVKEALLSFEGSFARAMHDPTEGGLLGGVQEIAFASKTGFKVYEEKMPIREETRVICKTLKIDPLKLISSGSLLISVSREKAGELIKSLNIAGIKATIIGELVPASKGMLLIKKNGEEENISEPIIDELWTVLSD